MEAGWVMFLREAKALSMKRYDCVKQVVLFFGNAGIGIGMSWQLL
ncbi:hypothetical protein HaLaN_30705 [Haematococcus lacustris]|uniref:Uncharacterized protein n=1 Tax=Haematococcus lacustris TaxID=44745 RepID=A0A6A0AG59_HAELA|nr:hypothetical protein HaLaN_30705 [Haematococcus lacustris]